MPRSKSKDLVTKEFFKKELKRELVKEFRAFELKVDLKFDGLKIEIDDKAREYRDQVLTELSEVMGELKIIRDENTAGTHQISELQDSMVNHEGRIKKIELTSQTI